MRISRTALSCLLRAKGLWDLSCRGDFRPWSANPIAVEQLQGVVQPWPTPSRPAEALAFPGSQHMAPNLLLYPVLDEAEAGPGVTGREVVSQAAQPRVGHFAHPDQRLRQIWATHVI